MRTAISTARLSVSRRWWSAWISVATFARRKPLGALGLFIVLLLAVLAVGADIIAPYDPNALNADALFVAPSQNHLLGTDNLGRDLFSRIIFGGRVSLYVGTLAVVCGSLSGAAVGVLSAHFGGKTDLLLQRFVDAMIAFPALVLAIALVAVLGASLNNVVIAVAAVLAPQTARVVRSAALKVREETFVEAAVAIGASHTQIMLRHIVPNVMAPFLILAAAQTSLAILAEASLSFLGLGVPPDTPSWGNMLSGAARQYVETAPWMAIYPGLALSLLVYGVVVLGDALRDYADPRLRG